MDTIDQNKDSAIPIRPARKRRQYSKALKRQMVEETLAGRDSVSVVARRYDVNANQLFKWRRQYREGLLVDGPDPQSLVQITVTPSPTSKPVPDAAVKTMPDTGSLEITLAGGHRLVVTGTVCPETLRTALALLSTC
jgi:transposase